MKLFRLRSLLLAALLTLLFSCAEKEKPKSVILFIADGMGFNQLSAFLSSSEENIFQQFPVIGLIDNRLDESVRIPESTSFFTTLATGKVVKPGKISLDDSLQPIPTLFEYARDAGKSTGIIVTNSVTYVSPAAFLTHVRKRSREYEIARQIATSGTEVILGGGRRFFENNLLEGENLLQSMVRNGYTFIGSKPELEVLSCTGVVKLLGLFAEESLSKARLREISIRMMMEKALCILEKNPKGFLLLVEGSQIDWRGHENDYQGLLSEIKDLVEGVQLALEYQEKYPDLLILLLVNHETGGLTLHPDWKGEKIMGKFATTDHTFGLVPLFARGIGANRFSGIQTVPEIAQKLIELIK